MRDTVGRRWLLIAFAIGVAGGLTVVIAIGAGYALRRTRTSPSATTGSGPSATPVEHLDATVSQADDPIRPRVALRFEGACHPTFDGAIAVQTGPHGHLRIASRSNDRETGVIAFYPQAEHPLEGRVELTQEYFEATQNQVLVLDGGPGPFGNYHTDAGDTPASVLGGFLTVTHFEPARGLADLTFEHVTLRNYETGTVCRIDGRLETFALTWGAARD